MVEKNRMRLSGIAAPEDNDIGFLNFAVGTRSAACSEDRRQTGDAWGVSSSVTAVDVVTTHRGAHELLRSKIHFVGGFGAAEHSKRGRTVPLDDAANTRRRTVEGLLPAGRA